MELTEKLTWIENELKERFDTIFSDISDYEFQQLAKFVLIRELEARVDEARRWYGADALFPIEKTTGYKELTDQIKDLRNGR